MSLRLVFVLVLGGVGASCGSREEPPHVFTSDEVYLIESYVRLRRDAAHYPAQPLLADSLLGELAADIDTTRVNRTVNDLNQTPERWPPLLQEIEKRLREAAEETRSEESRS